MLKPETINNSCPNNFYEKVQLQKPAYYLSLGYYNDHK